jgi:hypothetical protein
MNTLDSIKVGAVALAVVFGGCERPSEAHFVLEDHGVEAASAGKDRVKSPEQWVSIVYTNLFQTGLPANDQFDIAEVFESIGDQDVAREVILSNFFNEEGVVLPSAASMHANPEAFIEETYLRFFVRQPTTAERTYLRGFLVEHPEMTPELVYLAFGLSEEYQHY